MTKRSDFTFFWRSQSPFSQWHRSTFEVAGIGYSSAEQYMMHQKAVLFGDPDAAARILSTDSPRKQKSLGRTVQGFDDQVWQRERWNIVLRGNLAKFGQNRGLRKKLMATGDTELVEASPVDCIWGVGLTADDPRILDRGQWRGLNLLGQILMEVRRQLADGT